MNATRHEDARKRILFIVGEDFYFLTYSLLLALDAFGADSPGRPLVDYRKAAFVSDFASSNILTAMLMHPESAIHHEDRDYLRAAHDRGVARLSLLFRLLYAMERGSLIRVSRNDGARILSVSLVKTNERVRTLLDAPIYAAERERLRSLRQAIPKLRSATLAHVLDRLFGSKGITTWLA